MSPDNSGLILLFQIGCQRTDNYCSLSNRIVKSLNITSSHKQADGQGDACSGVLLVKGFITLLKLDDMKIFGIIVAIALTANLFLVKLRNRRVIKSVINPAYVEGIHNPGDLNQTRSGFHPDFEMYFYRNVNFSKRSLSSCISAVEAG